MIRYLEWAQRVVRACLKARPTVQPLTLDKLAEEVGLTEHRLY